MVALSCHIPKEKKKKSIKIVDWQNEKGKIENGVEYQSNIPSPCLVPQATKLMGGA